MSPQQMRAAVATAYPGANWPKKVAAMSDKQIFALYTRLSSQKKI